VCGGGGGGGGGGGYRHYYTAKNDQVVAILMKTGLNNVVRPTLFTVVNNPIQAQQY
jgi:hypothetical protein